MGLRLGIVFDMDDTLYLERDYVRSGFRFVAERLGEVQSDAASEAMFAFLWRDFEAGIRRESFNRLLLAFPCLAKRVGVPKLVDAYQRHAPCIAPLPDVLPALESLWRQGFQTGLLSDGRLLCQTLKWYGLGLQDRMSPVLFTDIWGRDCWKPHTRGFEQIAAQWQMPHAQMVYVGDNPAKDFVAPRRLGWLTIRLRMRGQLHYMREADSAEYAPHVEIESLSELESALSEREATE